LGRLVHVVVQIENDKILEIACAPQVVALHLFHQLLFGEGFDPAAVDQRPITHIVAPHLVFHGCVFHMPGEVRTRHTYSEAVFGLRAHDIAFHIFPQPRDVTK
jgi:hypothetical protein